MGRRNRVFPRCNICKVGGGIKIFQGVIDVSWGGIKIFQGVIDVRCEEEIKIFQGVINVRWIGIKIFQGVIDVRWEEGIKFLVFPRCNICKVWGRK